MKDVIDAIHGDRVGFHGIPGTGGVLIAIEISRGLRLSFTLCPGCIADVRERLEEAVKQAGDPSPEQLKGHRRPGADA